MAIKKLSNRPYLIQALYDWIIDSQGTPYIIIDTKDKRVQAPKEHSKDNEMLINISPVAIRDFMVDENGISFRACFSGTAYDIYAPLLSVRAIYAAQNPSDTFFELALFDNINHEKTSTTLPDTTESVQKYPPLRLVSHQDD